MKNLILVIFLLYCSNIICCQSCCEAHPTGGCDDRTVSTCVCQYNSNCCTGPWTESCVDLVTELSCGFCTSSPTNSSNCCTSHSSPGCSDSSIQQCVCSIDVYCCKSEWDDNCVNEAYEFGCITESAYVGWVDGPSVLRLKRWNGFTGVAVENTLYLIGGYSDDDDGPFSQMYNADVNQWKSFADSPIRVSYGTAAFYEDKIYVVGGQSYENDNMQVYNISTDSWVEIPLGPSFSLVQSAGVCILDDILYVIGGSTNTFSTNYCQRYNIATRTWEPNCESLPESGANTAIIYEGLIYSFGDNFVCVYDSITDTWETKSPSVFTFNHTVTLFEGLFYKISTGSDNSVQVYNPEFDTWTSTTTSLNDKDTSVIAASLSDQILYVDDAGQMAVSIPDITTNC